MRCLSLEKSVVFFCVLGISQASLAAQQCLSLPGTYGAVTVTGCDSDPANGIINPISSYGSSFPSSYPYDGLALGQLENATASCTYSFNHSVLTTSVFINVDGVQEGDVLTIEANGQPYPITSQDVVMAPLPGAFGVQAISAIGGSVTVAAPGNVASGRVQLLSRGPQRINQLNLSVAMTNGLGAITQVCLDDADVVPQTIAFTSPPPASATVGGASYEISAQGGASGNPVAFSVDPASTGVCSVSGSTVSFKGAGTCVIHADQAGNASYAAAPTVQQSIVVTAAPVVTQDVTAVPTWSEWGALLMSGVLGGLGLMCLRRRQRVDA